ERLGAKGWSWPEVTPVFRRMERWSDASANQSRGRLGPMRVANLKAPNPLSIAFVESAPAIGPKGSDDYNAWQYHGAWLSQTAQANGARFSAYNAYLVPAMRRKNLSVRTHASVSRILFDATRATGVATERDGREEIL